MDTWNQFSVKKTQTIDYCSQQKEYNIDFVKIKYKQHRFWTMEH